MPLFELSGTLIKPFRRLHSDAEIYEKEIEDLFWENLEAFAGEPLFPVARQLVLPNGGIPDIVALDADGRIVIIEIKRDVEKTQVSQCLEYAGWGRQSSLDELARLYRAGPEQFFTDWQAFTGTSSPSLLHRVPRLMLVARAIHGRTGPAIEYLRDTGVPIDVITVVFYVDGIGNRIVDVDSGRELPVERPGADPGPRVSVPTGASRYSSAVPTGVSRYSSAVTLSDLLEAGAVESNEPIEWRRPQVGEVHRAMIADTGEVVLADGRRFTSLSSAANATAGGSNNGWICWTVPRLGGVTVGGIRAQG
jgi:Restriction Enzyme Adenine Methylase Associated